MAFWAHNHKSHRYIYAVLMNSTVRKAIPHSTAHNAKISDNIDLCAVLCATVWMGLMSDGVIGLDPTASYNHAQKY